MEENNQSCRGISEETEKLFKRYLKLEIAARVWGGIFRIIILILVIFSVVFSTTTLMPLITNQLGALTSVYGMPTNGAMPINLGTVNELVENLNEEQKQALFEQIRGVMDEQTGDEK